MPQILKDILIEKFDGKNFNELKDIVILESRVSIYLNGEKSISTMCIPIDMDAHAVGFLMAEGVIKDIDDIESINIDEQNLKIEIEAKIDEENLQNLYKEKTLVSGCGGGVTGNSESFTYIDFNDTKFSVTPKYINDNINKFYEDSELYKKTGCVHKAMLILEDETKLVAEDIGRHNAIDKAVGKAKLKKLDTKKSILMVSGRLSSEMVIKAVMHRLPIVVSRTAPTFLGVKTALEHGITLIGFARGRKMNIYTHSGRIVC